MHLRRQAAASGPCERPDPESAGVALRRTLTLRRRQLGICLLLIWGPVVACGAVQASFSPPLTVYEVHVCAAIAVYALFSRPREHYGGLDLDLEAVVAAALV